MADEQMKTSGVIVHAGRCRLFRKRTLLRTAGFWGLWGIGIAAVISGTSPGWNWHRRSGLGGLGIATVAIIVMYFGMLFSIGEMSAAMPHTGGASFARAVGPGRVHHRLLPKPSISSSPPRSSSTFRRATRTKK